jgi:hypothetical protein
MSSWTFSLIARPYVETSAAAWAAVEAGISEGMLAAHAVTTIHYLVQKEQGTYVYGEADPECGRSRRFAREALRQTPRSVHIGHG